MRIVSARWVIPIDRPPIAEGAVALDEDGTVRMVGPRAAVRAEFSDAPEERAEGVLLPGLVNAHCHLELSALADAVPGGGGFIAWAQRFLKTAGETPRERAASRGRTRRRPRRSASARRPSATSATRSTPRRPSARRASPASSSTSCSARARRRPATRSPTPPASAPRWTPTAAWPADLGYVRAPHAPYSVGPRPAAPDLRRRAPPRSAPPRSTSPRTRTSSRCSATAAGAGRRCWRRWASTPRPACPASRRSPTWRRWARSTGRAPPLLVHMVHAGADDRRLAREAGATVVLCPRSNLHIGGRLADVPALLADGVSLALGTDSLASTPDLSLWGEMATLAAHFPSVPAARWLEAATRGGAQALGLARPRHPGPRQAPRRARRAGRRSRGARSNRWSAIRSPTLRWVAQRMSVIAWRTAPPDRPRRGDRHAHGGRRKFGRMIKFEHTLFALPFALAAAAIAARGHGLSVARLVGIVVAMAGARTAAMGFNRIVDRHIDAKNPRTAKREIPAGRHLAARRLDDDPGRDRRLRRRRRGARARSAWRSRRWRWSFSSATRSPSGSRRSATSSSAWPSPRARPAPGSPCAATSAGRPACS